MRATRAILYCGALVLVTMAGTALGAGLLKSALLLSGAAILLTIVVAETRRDS